MRSLDEYKAEIFHRSEVKIKQRKKMRNRILAACIPVCLVIGIGTAGFAAGGLAAKSVNNAAAPESALMSNGSPWLESVMDDVNAPESEKETTGKNSPNYSVAGAAGGLSVNGETYWLGEDYNTIKNILENLTYSPHKVCRCLPQYKIQAEFGSFGIHLSEGYARCEAGQADLTAEQIQTIRKIFENLPIETEK